MIVSSFDPTHCVFFYFYIYIYLCVMQGAAASPERITPRGGQPSGIEVPTKLMMEPSDDDDEDTGKTNEIIHIM